MKKLPFITYLFAVLAIIGVCSCNKDTTCKAKIKCKDANGSAISNAKVNLFATVENENKIKFRADLQAEGTTDSNGEVSFTFKLPAIYDINVSANNKTATGLVKLEEGKTVNNEIIVQ